VGLRILLLTIYMKFQIRSADLASDIQAANFTAHPSSAFCLMRCILQVQICINVVLVSSAYSASHLDSILFHRPSAGFKSFMCVFGIQFAYFGSGESLVSCSCERGGVQSRWQLLYLTSQHGSSLTCTIM
jgi:hypothetical protein